MSVTGEILVKVGFAAVDSTAGSKDGTTSKDSSATGILTSEQRQSLVQALTARGVGSSDAMATSAGNVSSPSRLHNTPAHAGQEERILLASPVSGREQILIKTAFLTLIVRRLRVSEPRQSLRLATSTVLRQLRRR